MSKPLVVIVQARVESQRFPSKVLAPLLGQPLLLWLLSRASQIQTPHQLVVAAPNTPANHAIANLCTTHGYTCLLVPGDPNDVLGRFHDVATQYDATTVVRLVGDTPLLDPQIIDDLLAYHASQSLPTLTHRSIVGRQILPVERGHAHPDLTGLDITWGDGFDSAVLSRTALDTAHNEATLLSDREHVEPFLFRQTRRFHATLYPCPFDLSWVRLSVDNQDDLAQAERVLESCLWHYGKGFGWRDVWATIKQHPDIEQYMRARPHNPAYAAQVAQEQGWPGEPSWQDLRYGVHT